MKTSLLRKLGLLAFVMLVVVLYFYGHNSLAQQTIWIQAVLRVFGVARDGVAVGLLLAIAGGIGRRLLLRVPLRRLSVIEALTIEAGFGLGIISSAVALLGLIGAYNLSLWLVLLLAGGAVRSHVRAWIHDLRHNNGLADRPYTPWVRFSLIFSAGLLIAASLHAFAPPFAWDAMTYHLEGPHRYIETGRIAAQPDNHFLGFPQGVEGLYGLLMIGTFADTAPALLHLVYGLLAIACTTGLVARHTDAKAAALVPLLYLSSYSLWILLGYPYVDLAMMAYGAFMLSLLSAWHAEEYDTRLLVLAGALGGVAFGIKYTAAAFLLAFGFFAGVRHPRHVLRNGLFSGGAALLFFIPWALKGWLLYDNPVYPYFFGGLNWEALRSATFSATGGGFLDEGALFIGQLPLLPFAATIFGTEAVSPYAFDIGPWLLTLPFLLLFTRGALHPDARRLADDALLLAIPLLLWWIALAALSGIGAQPRLLLIGAPVAVTLGALGFHGMTRWLRTGLDVGFIVQALLVLSLLFGLANPLRYTGQKDALGYLSGADSRADYLTNNLGITYTALANLPPDSTVLFLWEPKTYPCPDSTVCLPDTLFDHWTRPLHNGATPDEIFTSWQDRGIDYLLVYGLEPSFGVGFTFWAQQAADDHNRYDQFPPLLTQEMQLVESFAGVYDLYTWRD